ncbi:MAG TPA: permease-like cell division protein FtsX [Nitriliruptorales bacterium]|nr:permease-like cell division protein FtsX [Nitriliruptorales bacterium]
MSARWAYLLREAVTGLGRNLLMTIAVILSVFVSLTLLGSSILFQDQVDVATDEWYGKIEVSIFLCDGRNCDAITPEQEEQLREELANDPLVREVFYESKGEAYESFKEMFKDQPDFVESVGPEALPASFRVKMEDPREFSAIYDKFKARPGVEEVVDQRETLRPIFAFIEKVRLGALVVAVVQLGAACVLIVNTIRVAAFARREQTAIMKLVGASNWYIRLPFVLEGVFAGLVGALLAWGVLLLAVPLITDSLQQTIQFMPFIGIEEAAAVGPLLLLGGVIIAGLSSLIALRRFLDV